MQLEDLPPGGVLIKDGDPIPAFVPLTDLQTRTATPNDEMLENVKENIKRNLVRLHHMPFFMKVKGNDNPIALVGGGPSAKEYIEEIKKHKRVVACGSSYDFLVENGIIPDYCVLCDPDAVMAEYVSKAHPETMFLVASGCNKKVYEVLADKQVVMWHCHSDEMDAQLKGLEDGYQAVGGGCTVGLRSLSMFLLCGYSNIHLYGFDSCLGVDDEHHAYGFKTENEFLGEIYDIKIGITRKGIEGALPETYRCAGYQLAQAYHFKDFYGKYRPLMNLTFHGRSLLKALVEMVNEEAEILKNDPVLAEQEKERQKLETEVREKYKQQQKEKELVQ